MKEISDLTAKEAIEELKAPDVAPGHTRQGLITRLAIIAGLEKAEGHKTALHFLQHLAASPVVSELDRNEAKGYLGRQRR